MKDIFSQMWPAFIPLIIVVFVFGGISVHTFIKILGRKKKKIPRPNRQPYTYNKK